MFVIRLYITALTLTCFLAFLVTRGIGVLEGSVVICTLLYMILDMREELQDLRSLESRVSSLSN